MDNRLLSHCWLEMNFLCGGSLGKCKYYLSEYIRDVKNYFNYSLALSKFQQMDASNQTKVITFLHEQCQKYKNSMEKLQVQISKPSVKENELSALNHKLQILAGEYNRSERIAVFLDSISVKVEPKNQPIFKLT